jgi:hypothetical protein
MVNRPFVLPPVRIIREIPGMSEWGKLRNKFSGRSLLRSKLFVIITGDLSVIDQIKNRWFYEELFGYAIANKDLNLLPALKKIAASERFDESLRQRASEVLENIEEQYRSSQITSISADSYQKPENLRLTLAGTRLPQTTEILRLLRDKSSEMKRLALFLIGKFKMTDMIQEVCECLNVRGIEEDAFTVLDSIGSAAAKEAERYYFKMSGNISTGRILLRLMSGIHPGEDLSFLVERLWSNSRLIKELSLQILLDKGYRLNDNEKEHVKKILSESCRTYTWIVTALISLKNNNNHDLFKEVNKEYIRWGNYIRGLIILSCNEESDGAEKRIPAERKESDISVPDLAGVFFKNSADNVDYKKILKKLHRFFPLEVPSYGNLLEDIINCDYNHVGIWTKASTLRSISEINKEDLIESVVALLFSPEQLLREEAARLIGRFGRELYRSLAERLPEATSKQIDKVVSGELTERELVYEKVRFLSSCFKDIKEDELLFLAYRMIFARNDEKGIYSQPANTIMWSFSSENSEPEIFVNQDDINDPGKIARDIRTTCYYCYVLPLNTISEFSFQYPESSMAVYEYIDNCEE